MLGVYVGTREENLAACVEICAEQIGEIAAGRLRKGELERAKENLKGRIVLSLESTSNRMSRLGKSLVTDTELLTLERVIAEIDAVDPDELAELAAVLLPPERLAAAGVGPDEERFRAAVGRASTSARRAGGGVKIAFFGAAGKTGSAVVRRLEEAGHEVHGIELGDEPDVDRLRRRGRLHDSGRGARERARRARAGRLLRRRHDRLGPGRARRARAGERPAALRRAELLASAPC